MRFWPKGISAAAIGVKIHAKQSIQLHELSDFARPGANQYAGPSSGFRCLLAGLKQLSRPVSCDVLPLHSIPRGVPSPLLSSLWVYQRSVTR